MATRLHVNGLASVYWGGTLLGWTVDGVDIDFIAYFEDIYTDAAGPHIPRDVMLYGEEARVTCDFIVYDTTVLNSAIARVAGGTPGYSSEQYGFLMAACGGVNTLKVSRGSACIVEDEGNWTFNCAYVMDSHTVKVGTRATRNHVVFRCLPNASGYLFTTS